MKSSSVKLVAALFGVLAIATFAFRARNRPDSSAAPNAVVGSNEGLNKRTGQPSGWIARSGGHDAGVPAAPRGSGDSLTAVSSTAGSHPNAARSEEHSADDPIRVQAAVPAAPVRASRDEGTQTGMKENDLPEKEGALNSGEPSSESPTPPADSMNPTPARRGSFFASMNFGLNSETLFPEPDSDFSPISITDNAGTISFCLQPQWAGGEGNLPIISSSGGAADSFSVTKDGQYLRFALADSTGIVSSALANINAWRPGERHLVTTTWGAGQTLLYVDGKLVGRQTYQGQLQGQLQVGPDLPLHIGSSVGDVPDAGGSLSQLQIQDRVMSESDIGDLVSGCR